MINTKNYSFECKNLQDGKKELGTWIRKSSNKELIKFFNKTDIRSIGYNFHYEYKELKKSSDPEYGFASDMLSKDMGDSKKQDFIIISVLFNNCIDIKEKVDFIPFDKMFFECGIRVINNKGEMKNINSFMIFKDKHTNVIRIYYVYNDTRQNSSNYLSVFKFNELDIDSKNWETERIKGVPDASDIDSGQSEMKESILKVLRHVSYKISTKEFRDYKVYKNGQLIDKELIYSSEVKAHKRHFWKDTGRFIIPNLSKEDILKKGYFIDELVYKNGELRRDVPYTIIGNSVRNKELEKQNRKISLIKKRIWRCEEKIYSILQEIYPDKIIRRHDRRTLNGLELDFNIPELRLGIEYDGEQHFDRELYEKLYGDGFDAQIRRDRKKNQLCRRKKIKLIRIKYNEPLTKTHIKKILQ